MLGMPEIILLHNGLQPVGKQWRQGAKGNVTLPIAYTSFYVPVATIGNGTNNWEPWDACVSLNKVSLSTVNIGCREGSIFWLITAGV